MPVNRIFLLVRKGDDLIQKIQISCFGNIFPDRGKEPQGIIRAVGRMPGLLPVGSVIGRILLSRAVGELYKGQSSAAADLGGEHKAELFRRHFRSEVDDALDILHGIPVAVTVSQPAVDEGGGPGPDKCHKAVVGVPGIEHGVKFRTGSTDL